MCVRSLRGFVRPNPKEEDTNMLTQILVFAVVPIVLGLMAKESFWGVLLLIVWMVGLSGAIGVDKAICGTVIGMFGVTMVCTPIALLLGGKR